LLDYIYTALHKSATDGSPIASPMFYLYPQDEKTFDLELQYFYGPSILVAPVTEENATSVDVYFPDDLFYDWYTHETLDSSGEYRTIDNQTLTDIPLYIRGGSVLPLRTRWGMTTTELRKQDFEVLIAPGRDGTAEGELYIDDGESLEQEGVTSLRFEYADGGLKVTGECGHSTEAKIVKITILGGGSDKVVDVEKSLGEGCGFSVNVME
jgi:alpha-glucosidase